MMASLRATVLAAACALSLALLPAHAASADGDLDREFNFASGLVELGFPDLAGRLVDHLLQRHPDQKDRSLMVRAEILIARRKFDDAEALLKEMPEGSAKTQATMLAIGNGYYRLGIIDKARELYHRFFDQYKKGAPTDPDLRRVYMDAAYRFGQMLELAGDLGGAVDAYQRVIDCKPDENIARRIKAELADLLVRAAKGEKTQAKRETYLNRAKKLCEDVQWGGIDLWFGRTIITLANVQLVKGDKKAAQEVIRDNMDILKEIDQKIKEDELPSSMSPMAGARYLLGALYEEQGDQQLAAKDQDGAIKSYAAALGEFVNVFAKYGDSDWGPDAGDHSEAVQKKLADLGKVVKIDWGVLRQKAMEAQFKRADALFFQKEYAKAAPAYRGVLNRYPEGDAVAHPLMNLILCFANTGRDLAVKATADYIGERFPGDSQAALALLAAGKYYYDAKNTEMYRWLYDRFVQDFPKHEKTPAILYTLAGLAREAGDEEANRKYLDRITSNFPGDQYYLRALNQKGWSEYSAERYEDAVKTYATYVKQSPPAHQRAVAQYVLADSLVRLKRYPEALREYRTLQQWLTPPAAEAYGRTSKEVAKNKDMLQKATFYVGYCLSKVSDPPDAVPELRKAAIQVLDQFARDYAQTDLAPKALNLIGTIQVEQGRVDAATKTFQDLQRRYPDSEDGKSALFSLVMAAVETKKMDVAREAFAKMKAEPKRYSPDQYVRVGQAMLDRAEYADAIVAFQRAAESGTEDRAVLERAYYGLGKAYYETKDYEGSVASLQELLTRYPKSGLFYDAKFILGRAYRDMGKPTEAIAALSDVFKYATNAVLTTTASLELGGIQTDMGDTAKAAGKADEAREDYDAALASYQRIALLGNAEDPAQRPLIRRAMVTSIPLFMKVGRFNDAVDAADQYLKTFPDGEEAADVRKWRAEARIKATGAAGGSEAPPGNGNAP